MPAFCGVAEYVTPAVPNFAEPMLGTLAAWPYVQFATDGRVIQPFAAFVIANVSESGFESPPFQR